MKIFAIAEKLSGDKIHILFQCDYHNLPWDRDYLEKYIPYVVNLTELTFERIVSELWNKCRLDEITCLKDRDIQNITIILFFLRVRRESTKEMLMCLHYM